MTRVTYNGVILDDVLTEGIEYRTVYDRTGVDPIGLQVTVTVVTMLVAEQSNILHGHAVGSGQLGKGMMTRLEALQQPRRLFVMTDGLNSAGDANVLFKVWPASTAPHIVQASLVQPNPNLHVGIKADIDNGPRTEVVVTNIYGDYAMRVRFKVTFMIPVCDTAESAGDAQLAAGITNLRYWFAESVQGRDWSTRRITYGRIRVLHQGVNVHQALRLGFVLPPLQKGMWRETIDITEDPGGLEAAFTVVDQERRNLPPWPATDWDIQHTVHSPQPLAPVLFSAMRVRIHGHVNTDKRDLIKLAFKVVDSKMHLLHGLGQEGAGGAFLQSVELNDHVSGNEVTLSAAMKHFPKDEEGEPSPITTGNLLAHALGTPLEDDLNLGTQANPVSYDPYRTALLSQTPGLAAGLFNAFLQDECHPGRMPFGEDVQQTPTTNGPGHGAGYDRPTMTYHQEDLDQPDDDNYSDDVNLPYGQKQYPYAKYEITSISSKETGTYAFPIAQDTSGDGVTAAPIQLHRGRRTRRVEIDAERIAVWPVMPAQTSCTVLGVPHLYLWSTLVPTGPVLSADGRQKLYRMEGTYEYEMGGEVDFIPVGRVPYMKFQAQENFVPPAFFFIPPSTAGPL